MIKIKITPEMLTDIFTPSIMKNNILVDGLPPGTQFISCSSINDDIIELLFDDRIQGEPLQQALKYIKP